MNALTLPNDLAQTVAIALAEDIGTGDITAQLVPSHRQAQGQLIAREQAIFCGRAWADETFKQVDPQIQTHWCVADGDCINDQQVLLKVKGPARSLLSTERTALNFLQTLSGTATSTAHLVNQLKHTQTKLLDTRKTIPGLRTAQKYAVSCGGGQNHRLGLFDAFLIKENHIIAAGSILKAITEAHNLAPNKPVEVEVESLDEFKQALTAKADIIMLDNFTLEDMKAAVAINQGRSKLEASGNIQKHNFIEVAQTGVDYISVGSLTKHLKAIDLSLRFDIN